MRLASAFLLLALLLPPLAGRAQAPAQARAFNPYSVAGLPVDVTSDTAAKARDIALAQGRQQALTVLLHRLTPKETWARLPKVATADIGPLVISVGVADERSSATRYLAKLTVDFRRDAIRSLLQGAGVAFADTVAQPALLLPVLEQPGGRLLFEAENPWRKAWAATQESGSLYPLLLPEGSVEDRGTITADQAAAGNADRLQDIARRYAADTVIVARGKLGIDFEHGGVPRLEVSASRFVAGAPSTVVQGYSAQGPETVDDLLRRAAADVAQQYEEQWKQETALRLDSRQSLSVRVPFDDLKTWVAIRGRLARVGLIERSDPERVTRQDVQLALDFYGTPEQLRLALAQSGLVLAEEGGYWLLRLRDRSAP